MPTGRAQLFADALLFAGSMLAGLLLSFYLPKSGWGDCREYPPLSVQRFPDQAVFTASLVFAKGDLRDSGFGAGSLMHVRQRFWGLPWWAPDFVIVRGFFRAEKGEYLFDVRRTQGLLTHFLPVFDTYPCCHTQPIDRAVADLRSLRDGPPRSGVRIIGTVYTDMFVTSEPSRNVEVVVTGPKGSISTTTDQYGIYDLAGLPEGHYSVVVNHENLGYFRHKAEADVKSGQVWGVTLIAPPLQTPER
jgi:hypothetical protein